MTLSTLSTRLGVPALLLARLMFSACTAIVLSTSAFGASSHCTDDESDHEWIISFNEPAGQGNAGSMRHEATGVVHVQGALYLAHSQNRQPHGSVYMDGDCKSGVHEHNVALSIPEPHSSDTFLTLAMGQ